MRLTQPCRSAVLLRRQGSALALCVFTGVGNFPLLSPVLLLVFRAIFSSLLIFFLFTLATNLDYADFSQWIKGL